MSESFDPAPRIAEETGLPAAGVRAVVRLLAEGATVPFIARYRKEQTGGLDEVAIRTIEERREYLTELAARRAAILEAIAEQGKLTPELRRAIEGAWVKSELEDLYLPYKTKRKTRASIARQRGLEPLALRVLAQPASGDPRREAAAFVDPAKEVPDVDAALAGARDVVAEIVAERPDVRAVVRERFDREGEVRSKAIAAKTKAPTKFEAYYDFSERARAIPSHRFLAIARGEEEGVLRVKVAVADEDALAFDVATKVGYRRGTPFAGELKEAVVDATKRLLLPSIESDVRAELKERSDVEAVKVFAENVKKLLLAAPLGRRVVLGIDPGQRTGCKCVVVDDTGKLLTHTVVHLVAGPEALAAARRTLADLAGKYRPFAIAVGNGTHGRETADFCREVLGEGAMVVLVSESGASVYSASDVAREELPDVDLTVRGAVSIARRLQDPLAELVKVDPKAIGVGQYQHDVHQGLLAKKLDDVVESCVSAVGVELNTASASLLSRVAGIGPTLAKRIVAHREKAGAFAERRDLAKVAGIGPKTFEQAAGFVRVRGAKNPLDASAVHPERYALVERIAKDAGVALAALVGSEELAAKIPWSKYATAEVGLPTLEDIRREIAKPGRDPRDAFTPPEFRDDVRTIEDVKPGMVLEGVVTNVTAFGAFVDLGVHQDGLVHVSQLSKRFVRDPHEVARVGDRLRVKVLEVDLARKRIGLSVKALDG
ncbi:MAG: RNA-binding transcriptional accessory protein [Myxococcales bacterium]|nr:RNA-binding transcriptional accessory protein [Myxococcales bacterium]